MTNLNRQFLFSDEDIGKPKATTAIKYIETHFPNIPIRLIPLVCDLTTLNIEFYEQFDFIISGLDAIKPRRFINEIIIQIVCKSTFEKVIPFIDGGTEGLKGHVKTILPGFTACWECSINTLPKGQDTLPMCTIINNPRNLKHVIEYVITIIYPLDSIKWDDVFADDKSDKIYQNILDASFTRAKEFNIDTSELNLAYVMGVIKRIIPSVSTMNAMIAANTCNEFLKIYHDMIEITDSGTIQANNFTILNGAEGCFSYSFQYERLKNCSACSKLYPQT